jgi:dUTP pyrophosphatase
MIRFERVEEQFKRNFETFTSESGAKHQFPIEVSLPTRKTSGSAGYDFPLPKDIKFLPNTVTVIATDVRCVMDSEIDMTLDMHIRSSLGIKHGLQLANITGIIDSDYAHNPDNGGNILIAIKNTTGITYEAKKGECIAQGILRQFFVTDDDNVTEKRIGGVGSTGK